MKYTEDGLRVTTTTSEALDFMEIVWTQQLTPDFMPDNESMADALRALAGDEEVKDFMLRCKQDPALLASRMSLLRAGITGNGSGKVN